MNKPGILCLSLLAAACTASHEPAERPVPREALLSAAEQRCAEEAVNTCSAPGASCGEAAAGLQSCVEAADCVSEDGLVDQDCYLTACPSETEAYFGCIRDDCAAYAACGDAAREEETPEEPGEDDGLCLPEQEACFTDDGAPCASELQAWADCGRENGCIDEAGVIDGTCIETRCGDANLALGECIYAGCGPLVDCAGLPPEGEEPAEPEAPETPDETFACEEEALACYEGEDAPCRPAIESWVACGQEAGCVDEGGVLDQWCIVDRCPEVTDTLSACLGASPACEPWVRCTQPPEEPAPTDPGTIDLEACEDAQLVCYGAEGPCETEAADWYVCADANGCIDEYGAVYGACVEESCLDETLDLQACTADDCPDVAATCG